MTMDLDDNISCPTCKGTGRFEWQDEVEDCATCNGTGSISDQELEYLHDEEDRGEAMMEDERGN